jgi:ASC-1-like (ASCH) protein
MHTSQILELNVQEPSFSLIKTGQKIVEGRLCKDKYMNLKKGDKIIFNEELEVEIEKVVRYPSFREMLIFEGLKNVVPMAKTLEEGEQIYYQFYTKEDEQKYGVVAICLSKLK